eukprot:scaffold293155_cov30-Tisochrysis_lutea.AAC.2
MICKRWESGEEDDDLDDYQHHGSDATRSKSSALTSAYGAVAVPQVYSTTASGVLLILASSLLIRRPFLQG